VRQSSKVNKHTAKEKPKHDKKNEAVMAALHNSSAPPDQPGIVSSSSFFSCSRGERMAVVFFLKQTCLVSMFRKTHSLPSCAPLRLSSLFSRLFADKLDHPPTDIERLHYVKLIGS